METLGTGFVAQERLYWIPLRNAFATLGGHGAVRSDQAAARSIAAPQLRSHRGAQEEASGREQLSRRAHPLDDRRWMEKRRRRRPLAGGHRRHLRRTEGVDRRARRSVRLDLGLRPSATG